MSSAKRILRKIAVLPLSITGFLRKDFTLLFRKKKYLYLSLLLPLLIGMIYVFTLTGSQSDIKIMVCDYDDSYLTSQAMQSLDSFTVTRRTDENCTLEMTESIKRKENLFGVVINSGFTENLENFRQEALTLYYDNSETSISSLASWKIDIAIQPFKDQLVRSFSQELKDKSSSAYEKVELAVDLIGVLDNPVFSTAKENIENAKSDLEKISKLDPGFVSSPVITHKKGVYPEYKMIEIGIAPLFSILSLFLLLMLCSTGVIYDRKTNLFSRIRASNSSMFSYVFSKTLFFFSLAMIQFVIILVLFFAFGATYQINLILLIKALLFISLVNSLIGFLIGLVSDSEGVAVLISLIITLPLLFLSGMFYPLDLMPGLIRFLARIMPLNTEIMMLKQAMLFDGAISGYYFLIPLGLFFLSLILLKKQR
ncbi:MAG: ABC transporter permease [Candidatus Woesearchaeota archaeon]